MQDRPVAKQVRANLLILNKGICLASICQVFGDTFASIFSGKP
jgi:hypothetical protein